MATVLLLSVGLIEILIGTWASLKKKIIVSDYTTTVVDRNATFENYYVATRIE